MRVISDSIHFFSKTAWKISIKIRKLINKIKFLNVVLQFLSLFHYLVFLITNVQFFFGHLFSSINKKEKSCPKLPDLTFKGMVNPDTPISQINDKNLTLPVWKLVSIVCLYLLHPRKCYKSQIIKSLPLISNTRQPALDNCNQTLCSMSLSKSECRNGCRMKWRNIRHRYQRFDFNSFWWLEKLLNQQFVSKQCNYTYNLISIYEMIMREKLSGITRMAPTRGVEKSSKCLSYYANI